MHDLHAHGNRMHKRQASNTVTRRRATTSAVAPSDSALAQVAAVTTVPVVPGRSGVANTGTGTRVVPTSPPTRVKSIESGTYSVTFATRASSYSPGAVIPAHSAGGSSSGADNVANSNSSSSTAGSNVKTGLSTPALVGIIAGGSALVVIIAVVAGCCCWKRKKAKKDAAWKQLNESQSSIAAYNLAHRDQDSVANFGAVSDSRTREPWTRADMNASTREKSESVAWDGEEKASMQQQSHQYQYPPQDRQQQQQRLQHQQQPQHQQHSQQLQHQQYAFVTQEQQKLEAARTELFSAERRAQSVGSELNNDVIIFGDKHQSSTQYPPTRNITGMTASSSNLSATLASQKDRQASVQHHAWRPSEVPTGAYAPSLSRDERRQVEDRDHRVEDRFRQVITGAVGRPDSAALEAERRERAEAMAEAEARAAQQVDQEAEEQRRREELRRKKDTIANLADAYGGNDDSGWPTEKADAIPKRSASRRKTNGPGETAPPSTSVTRRQPTAARYSSRVDSKPLRELEDILDSFHNEPSHERSGLPPLPSGSSSGGSSSGSSHRTESVLSGMSNVGPLNLGRSNGHTQGLHSVSSSLADYSSMRNGPTNIHSPLATVVESSSQPSQLSLEHESLSSNHGPLQSTPPRNSPLRNEHSHAMLGVEDSPTSSEVPSWGHSVGPSPATTPLTPHFNSASPWDRAGEAVFQQQQKSARKLEVAGTGLNGFEPLSSLAPDTSYRSATLSIYGMYDDDDAPELKGLPLDDPRVSRHLSELHGNVHSGSRVLV